MEAFSASSLESVVSSSQLNGHRSDSEHTNSQRPDSQRPDSQRPDSQRPDSQRPESQRPDSQRPDSQRSDSRRSGVSTTAAKPPASVGSDAPAQGSDAANQIAVQLCEHIWQRVQLRADLRATYRCQFQGAAFRFADAARLAPYMKALGVTHLYASPLLKSQSGSTHGYDVVDPTQLNDELGSAQEFSQMVDVLHAQKLGHLMDIVPNHMSVANDQNLWWMDVLKHGAASRYARYFDIDWQPVKSELNGRVLLPVLDSVSGNVLEAGRLAVRYYSGEFCVECNNCRLPLDPKTCGDLLVDNLDNLLPAEEVESVGSDFLELQSIAAALRHLPPRDGVSEAAIAERHRETLVIQRRLHNLVQSSPAVDEHLRKNLRAINGTVGQPRSFDRLDQLLENQAYRLVHWKASSDEINYRRFFDVSTLAALSIENLAVFETTHRMVLELAAAGQVDAFRVDHVDGLFDPAQYLWRLQWCYLRELGRHQFKSLDEQAAQQLDWSAVESKYLLLLHKRLGGADPVDLLLGGDLQRPKLKAVSGATEGHNMRSGQLPLPVYVEKILGAEEPLPQGWPVLGTTGYEFLNALNGLFIEPHGFKEIQKTYVRFVQDNENFEDVVYKCKRLILSGPMQSEVTLLASRLDRLAHRSRHWRDFTLNALQFALQEIIACFSVYRTYIREGFVSKRDEQVVQRAVATAKRRNPAVETNTFDFVRDVLLLTEPSELDDEAWRERAYLIGRFQQVTSPVQAKGVEDTAFYRYVPLLSIDEVGGEPKRPLKSISEYHQQNEQRQSDWRHSMLATTTHDTKRSEDVRARINVLSEVPGAWRKALQRWHRLNRKHVREVDGQDAPSRNDQWLLYQTLVGVWPVSPPSEEERQKLIERLQQYMEKATHEAKVRTSWISPHPAYDAAVMDFVELVLADANSKFVIDLQKFVDATLDAGLINAASQVMLKLSAPGVPDVYQGQEIWDFSLVDPDNRRPVDYDLRRHLLAEVQSATYDQAQRLEFARYLASNPRDNRLKMWVTLEGLRFRQQLELGREGLSYLPLVVEGTRAENIVAYVWQRATSEGERSVGIVVVPRFVHSLLHHDSSAADADLSIAQRIDWGDTTITLSAPLSQPLVDAFTGSSLFPSDAPLKVRELLKDFPIALLN